MESEPGTPALSRSSSSAALGGELPGWIPDASVRECMSCKKAFGFSRRRHHCRNCGWCICSACSPHTISLAHLASNTPQRVCNDCFENLRQVAQIRLRAGGGRMGIGGGRNSAAATPARTSRASSVDEFASPFVGSGFITPGVGVMQTPSSLAPPSGSNSAHASPQQPLPPPSQQQLQQQQQHHHARVSSMPLPPATSATPLSPATDPFPPSPSPTPSPVVSAAAVASSPVPASPAVQHQPAPLSVNVAAASSSSSVLSATPSSPSSVLSPTSAQHQLQMLPLTVPAWSYVFKPFSGPAGADVSVGRVAVTVRQGEHLPALDFLFNNAAPYVVVWLGNGRKRTHTLSPPNASAASSADWSVPNASAPLGVGDGNGTNVLMLDVPNVLEVLHVELWEQNTLGKDMLVASAELPLSQLARPEHAVPDAGLLPAGSGKAGATRSFRADAWLPLRVSPALQASKSGGIHTQALAAVSTLFNPSEWAAMSADKKRAATAKKEAELKARAAAQQRKGSFAGASSVASSSLPPRLHVELAYSYSALGEFWSHFTPPASAAQTASVGKAERRAARAAERAKRKAAAAGQDEDKSDEEDRSDEDSDEEDEAASSAAAIASSADGSAVEPFRLQTSYDLLRRSLALLFPLYNGVSTFSHSLSPSEHPLLWLLLSALLFACACNPSLIPVLVVLWLLRHMTWSWLYRRRHGGSPHVLDAEWQNYSTRAAAAAAQASSTHAASEEKKSKNLLVSALQLVNPLKIVSPLFNHKKNNSQTDFAIGGQQDDHPDVATLERVLSPLLRLTLLTLGGSSDPSSLSSLQATWSRGVEMVQTVRDAFDWSGRRGEVAGRSLVAALLLSLLWCVYFSPAVPLAVALTYFASRATVLGSQAEWILLSTAAAVAESKMYQRYLALCGGKSKQA